MLVTVDQQPADMSTRDMVAGGVGQLERLFTQNARRRSKSATVRVVPREQVVSVCIQADA